MTDKEKQRILEILSKAAQEGLDPSIARERHLVSRTIMLEEFVAALAKGRLPYIPGMDDRYYATLTAFSCVIDQETIIRNKPDYINLEKEKELLDVMIVLTKEIFGEKSYPNVHFSVATQKGAVLNSEDKKFLRKP